MERIKVIPGQVLFDSDLDSHPVETNHVCKVDSLRKVGGLPNNSGKHLQCTFS